MAALGAGRFVLPKAGARAKKIVNPEELRAGVRRILADPVYAANARKVGEMLATRGGASEAARLIEGFVQG